MALRKKGGARIVHEVGLSMDKTPPALPAPSMPRTKTTPPPEPSQPDPIVKMIDDFGKVAEAFSRFKAWLNAPDLSEPSKTPKTPAPTKSENTAPPFDIQDIPGAMRKELMPVSAKLMERWFAGELNYGRTDQDTKNEINQRGEPYPPSMYDMTTVRLDWVLRHRRAKHQYDALIGTLIHTHRARTKLAEILKHYARAGVKLDTWVMCGENLRSLHKHFQFTFADVGSTLAQKLAEDIDARLHNNGVPDDLNGALGSFNLYAAVAYATFDLDMKSVKVSGIYVYIKDSYSFTDKPGDVSQYLGHWSHDGVIVLEYNGFVSYLNVPALYRSYAVTLGNPAIKGNVYYPIHNKDFREWSLKHRRGGDFVVFSNYRFVPIHPPIRVCL